MARIENLHQLRAEIERLETLSKNQEERIKNDLKEIREELSPMNLVIKAISSLTGIRLSRNEFVKEGVTYGLSLLFQRLFVKAEHKMEHTVEHLIESAIEGIKKFISRFRH